MSKNCRTYKIVFLILFLFFFGCASSTPYKVESEWSGYQESGAASYYGAKHHGKKTASGERFNQYALTAAHRKLPFGTKVMVTNMDNNKNIIVTINDRGPFKIGRIIDLSKAAFTRIGDLNSGLIKVKIKVVQ